MKKALALMVGLSAWTRFTEFAWNRMAELRPVLFIPMSVTKDFRFFFSNIPRFLMLALMTIGILSVAFGVLVFQVNRYVKKLEQDITQHKK